MLISNSINNFHLNILLSVTFNLKANYLVSVIMRFKEEKIRFLHLFGGRSDDFARARFFSIFLQNISSHDIYHIIVKFVLVFLTFSLQSSYSWPSKPTSPVCGKGLKRQAISNNGQTLTNISLWSAFSKSLDLDKYMFMISF